MIGDEVGTGNVDVRVVLELAGVAGELCDELVILGLVCVVLVVVGEGGR